MTSDSTLLQVGTGTCMMTECIYTPSLLTLIHIGGIGSTTDTHGTGILVGVMIGDGTDTADGDTAGTILTTHGMDTMTTITIHATMDITMVMTDTILDTTTTTAEETWQMVTTDTDIVITAITVQEAEPNQEAMEWTEHKVAVAEHTIDMTDKVAVEYMTTVLQTEGETTNIADTRLMNLAEEQPQLETMNQ